MEKLHLGRTVSILANLGVLVGILLLVYELAQNREMMSAQTRNAIAEKLVDVLVQEATTPEVLTMERKRAAGESLSPEEQTMFRILENAYWRYRENVHYQYRNGLYEESEYLPLREFWMNGLNTDEMAREHWCSRRQSLSRDFVSELEGLMERS